jgi:tetratricopeptide (TPR) repeat protein
MANAAERFHQPDTAIEYFSKSLAISDEINDEEGKEVAFIGIGNNRIALGEYTAARDALEKALEISRAIEDRQGEIIILASLAELTIELGQSERAREHCLLAIQIAQEIDAPSEEGYAVYFLGRAYEVQEKWEDARVAFQRSADLRQQIEQIYTLIDSKCGLARATLALGETAQASLLADAILEGLLAGSVDGMSEPVLAFWTCFYILRAEKPEKAAHALQAGYDFLMSTGDRIQDEVRRSSFLENVAANRKLLRVWRAR